MILAVPTFEYVIKDEAGELLGTYTSTDEPPMKGAVMTLENIPAWAAVEVLGVTMLLTEQHNTVTLKVRRAEVPPTA